MVERHFAWFSRETGAWLREWKGFVPAPVIDPAAVGDANLLRMNEWQQGLMSNLGRLFPATEEAWDRAAWEACPPRGAVSLDVTHFRWPVGDHVWHVWDETGRMLTWPEASGHKFIEINIDTLEVVANQHSHRPIRDGVPGQHVIDITGTPYESLWGHIWGRFVWRCDRWGFEPSVIMRDGAADPLLSVPEPIQPLLEAAAVTGPIVTNLRHRVPVYATTLASDRVRDVAFAGEH